MQRAVRVAVLVVCAVLVEHALPDAAGGKQRHCAAFARGALAGKSDHAPRAAAVPDRPGLCRVDAFLQQRSFRGDAAARIEPRHVAERARVVGLFVAALLLVEDVELVAVIHLFFDVDRKRVFACLRVAENTVVSDVAVAVYDHRGNLFVPAGLCADVLDRIYTVFNADAYGIKAAAAVVLQRQLPVCTVIIADRRQTAVRFSAFGGRREEDFSEVNIQGGTNRNIFA